MNKKYIDALDILFDYSIWFNVQFGADGLEKYLETWGESASDILDFVKEINHIMPVMNFPGDNPNNGRHFHTFRFGREYSLVLYLDIITAYLPENYKYVKLISKLESLAHEIANEFDVKNESGQITIRFWFDKR